MFPLSVSELTGSPAVGTAMGRIRAVEEIRNIEEYRQRRSDIGLIGRLQKVGNCCRFSAATFSPPADTLRELQNRETVPKAT